MMKEKKAKRRQLSMKVASILFALVLAAVVVMPIGIFADSAEPESEVTVELMEEDGNLQGDEDEQAAEAVEEITNEELPSDVILDERPPEAEAVEDLSNEELPSDVVRDEIVGIVIGTGYEFDHTTGKLTVTSDEGTTNWRTDTNISNISDQDRYNSIKSVEIENGVTEIGDRAFDSCSNLVSVTLPASLQSINYYAFNGCTSLTGIDFSTCTSLRTIGVAAFQQCTALDSVDFSACTSLQTIETAAFHTCETLKSVDFSGCTDLQTIGNFVFQACKDLQSVDLSGCTDLRTIGSAAFSFTNLASIDFTACTSLQTIGVAAFSTTKFTSIDLSACTSLQSIDHAVFEKCENLASVTFPESLQTMGGNMFSNCTNLSVLWFRGATPPPTVNPGVFNGIPSTGIVINCPTGSEALYTDMINNTSAPSGCTVNPLLSTDAGLYSVAMNRVTPGAEAGTSADPITASISVTGGVSSIATSDIRTTDVMATWHIYSDRGFSQDADVPVSLPIDGGDTHVYVKVTAENGTTILYYDVTATVPDTLSPVPGIGGTITTANASQTSLTLNWTAASDNVTAAANLKYYVYTSIRDNISSVSDCTANGTLLNAGGTANITSFGVGGLPAATTYYFNVLVEDAAGNRAAYQAANATTLSTETPPIVYPVLKQFDNFTGSGTVTARIDADHTKFMRLSLDGTEISPSSYTITQGSTVITLSEAYLKTYANGVYVLKAEFKDGISEDLSLRVNVQGTSANPGTGTSAGGTNPNTGDNANPMLWWLVLVLATAGMLKTSQDLFQRHRM
ncbi:MAG: leucine-rich repeat protein [Clostridiales Family XIII bacterium]|nr:leucine-rich repeat protein [Clostridiales Family XIII bacterium]